MLQRSDMMRVYQGKATNYLMLTSFMLLLSLPIAIASFVLSQLLLFAAFEVWLYIIGAAFTMASCILLMTATNFMCRAVGCKDDYNMILHAVTIKDIPREDVTGIISVHSTSNHDGGTSFKCNLYYTFNYMGDDICEGMIKIQSRSSCKASTNNTSDCSNLQRYKRSRKFKVEGKVIL